MYALVKSFILDSRLAIFFFFWGGGGGMGGGGGGGGGGGEGGILSFWLSACNVLIVVPLL